MDLNQQIDYRKLFEEAIQMFPNSSKWSDGAFCGIKTVSNTSVGNVGEYFITKYAELLGFDVVRSENRTSWDVQINGIKYELKTATEDVHRKFQFNHFRTHRQYDAVICLGVSPNHLYFDVLTKTELLQQPLVSMEKGANASYKWTRCIGDLHSIEDFKEMIEEFTIEFQEEKQRQQAYKEKREKIGKH